MAVGEDVYCTLVMNDAYLPGAAVLAKSLRDAGTQKKLACMIVQEHLRPSTIEELQTLYNYVIPISPISSPNVAALYLMRRPDLQHTFSKIHLWRFTQFRKIVYVDADVVALRAPDELFDTREDFAAAPDVGFPSIFNTGVMVLTPDSGTYAALRNMANVGDSFDGADQGLLNQYFEFKKWRMLSFTYNCTPNASYQYEPAYRYFKRNISMVHFIGREKPWQKGRSAVAGASGAYQELLGRWWAVYDRHFRVSPADFVNGLREPPSYHPSRDIHGDSQQSYYATGYPMSSTPAPATAVSQESRDMRPDEPCTDPGEPSQNIDEGRVEPLPTRQARRFSAPHMEWDATRAAPPVESKPEAANFPTATYEFSTDATPYRPPRMEQRDFPEDVNYEIPKPKTEEKPAPIFPWEEREQPKPVRKFIEDEPLPAPPAPEPEPVAPLTKDEEVSAARSVNPASMSSFNTWGLFDARSKNAWDGDMGIESYVRALSEHQRNRGKPSVPPITNTNKSGNPARGHMMTPSTEIKADELVEQVGKRRESLLLMDFPSAVERPSLPVTPAPVRRSTFWGGDDEGAEESSMPQAEGVPRQQDWDPAAQLEQLRRNSLINVDELNLPERKAIPKRDMPGSATSMQEPLSKTATAAVPGEKVVEIATSIEPHSRDATLKNTFRNVQYTSEANQVNTSAATDFEVGRDSRVVEMLDDGAMSQSLREDSQRSNWEAQQAGMFRGADYDLQIFPAQNVPHTSHDSSMNDSAATEFEVGRDGRVVDMLDEGSMGQSLREDSQKEMWEARRAGMLSRGDYDLETFPAQDVQALQRERWEE